jgi:threonine synthase
MMPDFFDPLSGAFFENQNPLWLSPSGEPSLISSRHSFHKENILRDYPGFFRYACAIPLIKKEHFVSLGETLTPITEVNFNGQNVSLKLEFLFPTGSYKDRGAAVMISAAKTLGVKELFEDSSGNAGCAVSAYAAAAGISCKIYVPENTSPAKIHQMQVYGANVIKVKGSRQDAADEALRQAEHAWFASHVYNPWFYEGTKTFAYELWEQSGGNLPDEILFPVGNGTLILGCHKGFSELMQSGLVSQMPSLSVAQAENCAPVCGTGSIFPTLAEGIAVTKPARLRQIRQVVKHTGGQFITVTEDEILRAGKEAGKKGFFIENTSAAALAAHFKTPGEKKRLIPLTGTGLKNK